MNKRALYIAAIITALLWLNFTSLAGQPGPPGGDGSFETVGSSAGVPLDGGIISLLIAGLGILAVRKFKRKKA